MKSKFGLLSLVLAFFLPWMAESQEISGPWNGVLDAGASRLHFVFHFERDAEGKPGCTMDIPEQNVKQSLKTANRAYVLETGTIALSGDARELMNDDSVKKAYLSE